MLASGPALDEPEAQRVRSRRGAIAVQPRAHEAPPCPEHRRGEVLHAAEVEERHARSAAIEQVVARVRIRVERAPAEDAPVGEPEEDLALPRARVLGTAEHVLEPEPLDVLRREHLRGRVRRDHAGDRDERVAFEPRGEGRLVACLRDVVQLLEDPLAELLRHPLGVDARGEQAHRSDEQREVREVGADRRRDVRVLHLHGHHRPVVRVDRDGPDRSTPRRSAQGRCGRTPRAAAAAARAR